MILTNKWAKEPTKNNDVDKNMDFHLFDLTLTFYGLILMNVAKMGALGLFLRSIRFYSCLKLYGWYS